jgi:hypothetical protein
MHSIKTEFIRFSDISLFDSLGSIGTYVIWDQDSDNIPCYIGQGSIVNRLNSHNSRFTAPLNGYIALFGHDDDKNAAAFKLNAELLESALLEIAKQTQRLSKNNVQDARVGIVAKLFDKHGKIKFTLGGHDPFSPPTTSRMITPTKRIISIFPANSHEVEIEHGWQKLRES